MKMKIFFFSVWIMILSLLTVGCSYDLPNDLEVENTLGLALESRGLNEMGLTVPAYKQARRTWCWAAADLMIMRYFNPNWNFSQSDIVKSVVGEVRDTHEGVSPGPFLTANGINYQLIRSPISYGLIVAYIRAGQPLLVQIQSTKQGAGSHFLVVYGYSTDASFQRVLLIDPFDGLRYWYDYTYLVDNPAYYWTNTWCNIFLK